MSKEDDYRCVQVKINTTMDYNEQIDLQQEALEKIVVEVGGKPDGGGMWLGEMWRDVFFFANKEQFKKIIKQAKEKGLVLKVL